MAWRGFPERRGWYPLVVVLSVGVAFGLLGDLFGVRRAVGQPAIQAAIERRGPFSPEKRAELYRQLGDQADVLEAQAAVLKTVTKLIGPTVVHIEADVSRRAGGPYGRSQVEEAGSGVVIQWKNKLYVLTNRHVVHGAAPEAISIHLADGRMVHPENVWDDVDSDVAVMAISASGLVPAQIGDSNAMEIGDFVLAVGSPFGLDYSVTLGIISAKGRRGLDLGRARAGVTLQNFIQTDAAINPGNSGGPLVNLRGEVIGINTAIASQSGGSEGVAFAIPINMFMHIAGQLIDRGKVSRAYLGVTLDRDFDAEKAAKLGLPRLLGTRVVEVTANSPAQAAKLQVGDVILQIDGTFIEDDNHLVNLVKLTEIGKEISLVVFRNGQQLSVKATLANLEQFRNTR